MHISLAIILGTTLLSPLMAASQTKIRDTDIKPTSAVSGKQMYVAYCASCHGADATGAGPAAGALKAKPTNLTLLAKQNNGKFPIDHVKRVLELGSELASHGSAEMPVWGPAFRSLNKDSPQVANLREYNLAHYLETLQVK